MLPADGSMALSTRYLPQLPDYGTPITIDHLLHHTSGLRDYLTLLNLGGVVWGDVSSNADALAAVTRQHGLNFQPGSAYSYSNTGYFLLAQIVEKVSGTSLVAFTKTRIFEPLAMADTRILDQHDMVVPHRASAYSPSNPNGFVLMMSNWEQTGDGALQSTVADLAKWDANFSHPSVGDPQLIAQLEAVGKLNDGTVLNYGRDLMINTYRGLQLVSHSGAFAGYKSELLRLPKLKLGVAVLCNRPDLDPSSLARRVADIYGAGDFPASTETAATELPAVTLSDPGRYAGVYWNAREGMLRRVEALDGKLWYAGPGGKQELLPLGDGRFVRDPQRAAKPTTITERTMVVERAGEPAAQFERVTVTRLVPAQMATVVGSYFSAELNATDTLELKDDKLWITAPRFGSQPLNYVFTDAFRVPRKTSVSKQD